MESQAARTKLKPIKAVTFDVGGTLIAPWPSVGEVYAEVAAGHGVVVPPEVLSARFKAAWRTFSPFENSRANWAQLVDETFRGLCDSLPSTTFFPELYARFARADAWRIFPDVFPALEALTARGIRLGILSNWDERLRGLLSGLGLDRHFQTFTISCEVGCSKPAARIFQRAAEQLGVAPGSILHVGDSMEMDVAGSEAAGFQSVLIERSTTVAGRRAVCALTDLVGIIDESGHVTN